MSWKKISGKGLWTNYKNSDTGEESIKEHMPKVVKTWCIPPEHNFIIKDMGKRLAVCSKCQKEFTFVVGRDKIKDNKVLLG